MQREALKKKQMDTMLAGITDPQEKLYAQIAPQEYVAGKLKPAKTVAKQLTEAEVQQYRNAGYKIPVGALVQADENGKLSLVEGTYQKEPSQFRVGETRTVPNKSGTGEITEVYGADGQWTQRGGVKPYYKPDEPNPFLPTANKTPSSLSVKTVTMQDVQDTATATGKTVDQVKQDLAAKKLKYKDNKMADLSAMLYGNQAASESALPSGEDYLRMLPKSTADLVRGYASGRMQISPRVAATTYGQQLLNAVYQYDPTYDVTDYNGRYNTAKDFAAGGNTGKKIASINTAMRHLQNLEKNYTNLDNFNVGGTYLNAPINATERFLGVKSIQNAYAGAQKNIEDLSGELANAFRTGGGMSEADIKRELASLNPNMPPEEMKAKVQNIINDLEGKVAEQVNSYNRTMGTNKTTSDFLSAEAKPIYDRLGAGGFGQLPQKQQVQQTTITPQASNVAPKLTQSAINAGIDQNTWNHMTAENRKLFP